MDTRQVQQWLLEQHGLRVEVEMSAYVLRHLKHSTAPRSGRLPVIGGNARTGVPMRQWIELDQLISHAPVGELPIKT